MRTVTYACIYAMLTCVLVSAPDVLADEKVAVEGAQSQASNCWVDAGQRYGIEPWLLYSIAQHESKLRPLAVSPRNTDGTYDIGIMQVNSWWLPLLRKRYGISESHLFEPCMNINVGAWILAQAVKSMGPNWEAVGAYNAGLKKTKRRDILRKKYADSIAAIYARNNRLRDTASRD